MLEYQLHLNWVDLYTEPSRSFLFVNLQFLVCFFLWACRHPLFPLLTLLFEKCEQSTQSSDCVTSASFDIDIQNFVHNQEKETKAFFSEDTELDSLVRIPVVKHILHMQHNIKNCFI